MRRMTRILMLAAIAGLLFSGGGCDENKKVKPDPDAREISTRKPPGKDAASIADGRWLINRIGDAANGSVIRIPAGRYLTSGPVRIHRKANLTIIFEDSTVVCRDINANVLEVNESKNISIVGGHFRHTTSPDGRQSQGSVAAVRNSKTVALYGAELSGSGMVAMYGEGSQNLTIFNCRIHGTTQAAFDLYNCSGVSIVRNEVRKNTTSLRGHNLSGLRLFDNTTHGNPGALDEVTAINQRYLELLNTPATR